MTALVWSLSVWNSCVLGWSKEPLSSPFTGHMLLSVLESLVHMPTHADKNLEKATDQNTDMATV